MGWNANGLKSHIGEFIFYLNSRKLDVACVCETKLNQSDKLKIRNFVIERADRPNARGGGVAIIINSTVNYKRIAPFQTSIEHVSVELENNTIITCIYAPPTNDFSINDLSALFPQNKKTLIIGDFNARSRLWKNRRQNRRGTTLADFVMLRHDVQLLHTNTPTHYPPNGMSPSYVDLALNCGLRHLSDLTVENALSSDHLPIHLTLDGEKLADKRIFFSYRNFNWDLYKLRVSQNIKISNRIESPEQIESEIKSLTKIIQREQNRLATKHGHRSQSENLPPEIVNLINFKNKVRKRWQRFKQETDRLRMNGLCSTIKQRISNFKNECWTKTLSHLSPSDQSLWRMTKKLRNDLTKIPKISHNGVEYFTNPDKSEAFATYLESIYTESPHTLPNHAEITNTANKFVSQIYPIPPHILQTLRVSPQEIRNTLKTFPNNKAPGPDGIPYRLLKNLPRKAIVQLMKIINAIFELQHFPPQFKQAIVIFINKPGKNPSLPSSYRPISLLNTLSKVVEKLFLTRFRKYCNERKLIPDEQFGFRPGHDTNLLAAKIVNDIFDAYNLKMNTTLLLLDMEKAFDSVWHAGLLYKLAVLHNIPLYFVSLLNSYLSKRTFQVNIENSFSGYRNLKSGVPQGTVLSPLLYTLYIADFPKFPLTNIALYADDTAVYSKSFYAQAAKQRLAHHLTLITPYFQKWKLNMNAAKTELVVFNRKFTNNKIINPLIVNGAAIHQKTAAKYLGIMLDDRLSFHKHISYTLSRTFSAQQKLYPLTCAKSPLSPYNKLLIYKCIIRPALTYGAPIWCSISDTQRKRLQVFQNRILRGVLSASKYTKIQDLHDFTGIEYISQYIDDLSEKFYRSKISASHLTKNLTRVRFDPAKPIKHGPPYKRLPLFFERWHPP